MPMYEFKCDCGHRVDKFLKMAAYNTPQTCNCGRVMTRQISVPSIQPDLSPYNCPITGKLIDGRKAHRENLARHGCRVLEAGETAQAKRAAVESERQLDKSVDETVESFVANLPTRKAEQLVAEIQGGLTAETVRL